MNEMAIIRILGSLVLIVLLILGVAWAARRAGVLRGSNMHMMRVLGSRAIGARQRIAMVEVEGVRMLLGIGPQQISLLRVMSEDRCPLDRPPSDADMQRFSATLSKALEIR